MPQTPVFIDYYSLFTTRFVARYKKINNFFCTFFYFFDELTYAFRVKGVAQLRGVVCGKISDYTVSLYHTQA